MSGAERSRRYRAKHRAKLAMRDPRPEYVAWQNLVRRCTNSACKEFPLYGGRGIKVCDRWLSSYEDFIADMGPRPSPTHSIDRINNDGDYEPGNCRWATRTEQAFNRRRRLKTLGATRWKDGRWKAQICLLGRNVHLGLFAKKEDAVDAYRRALDEFNQRGRRP